MFGRVLREADRSGRPVDGTSTTSQRSAGMSSSAVQPPADPVARTFR